MYHGSQELSIGGSDQAGRRRGRLRPPRTRPGPGQGTLRRARAHCQWHAGRAAANLKHWPVHWRPECQQPEPRSVTVTLQVEVEPYEYVSTGHGIASA
eukprot:2440416-Rhodomonas_salina.1